MSSVCLVFQPFVLNYLDAAALLLALAFTFFPHFTPHWLPGFVSWNEFSFVLTIISTNFTFLEPQVLRYNYNCGIDLKINILFLYDYFSLKAKEREIIIQFILFNYSLEVIHKKMVIYYICISNTDELPCVAL